jgi:hypothetical protein
MTSDKFLCQRAWLSIVMGSTLPWFVPCGLASASNPPESEIRRRLDDILARPEFLTQPPANLWQQFVEWFARLADWLAGLRVANPVLFWLILIVCLTLLVLIVAHIVWTVRRVFFMNPQMRQRDLVREQRVSLGHSFWEEAQRKASEREFTEAVRCLFLSLVYHFDETGRVLFQKASTNREYLALLADRPEIQSELAVFVDMLDDNWYGQQPTRSEQYEDCLALYESLK